MISIVIDLFIASWRAFPWDLSSDYFTHIKNDNINLF